MAVTDDRSGAARIRAKAVAAAAYQAHVTEQRSKSWRIAFVDDAWRVAVQRQPGGPWIEPVAPFPGVSDVGDCGERVRMGAWLRDQVLEVEGIVLDWDYTAGAQGRVAYTVEITR